MQNCEKRLLASLCLSVCPYGATRLPLEAISGILYFSIFSKTSLKNSNVIKIGHEYRVLYLHEDRYTFMFIRRSFLFGIINVSGKSFRENHNKHFINKNNVDNQLDATITVY